MSAGGNGECLDDSVVSAGFILAVNDGGLAAGVNNDVIRGFVVGILYILYILGLIGGNFCGRRGGFPDGRRFGCGGGSGLLGCEDGCSGGGFGSEGGCLARLVVVFILFVVAE